MDNTPPVFEAETSPQMTTASENARATFGYFWRELTWENRRIVPSLDVAAVKVVFETDDVEGATGFEQMWLGDVDFDGSTVSGVLLNNAQWIEARRAGDKVEVVLDEITDWMYARDGVVFGGHTVDVIRSEMTPTEREAHDAAWGLDFGGAGDVDLIPASKAQNSTTAPNPDIDHPMAVHMAAALEERLASGSIDVHDTADNTGLSLLHKMVLGGSGTVVKVLLDHGADASAPAPNGMTPAQLAQAMGWKHLVRMLQR